MRIEVLGMGCAKCKRLEENVHEAVRETGVGAIVVKVQDPDQIIGRGVMFTPALIIDGEEKAIGRVPSVKEIKTFLVRVRSK